MGKAIVTLILLGLLGLAGWYYFPGPMWALYNINPTWGIYALIGYGVLLALTSLWLFVSRNRRRTPPLVPPHDEELPTDEPSSLPDDGKLDAIPVYPGRDAAIKIFYLMIQAGFLVLGILHEGFEIKGQPVPLWAVLLPFQVAHLLATLFRRQVEVSQVAARFLFGATLLDGIGSGSVFDPPGFPIVYVYKPAKIEQDQIPAEPELIFKGTDDEYDRQTPEEKAKFKRPLRILVGAGEGEDELSRQVLEFVGVLQIVIKRVAPWRARFGDIKDPDHPDDEEKNHRAAVKEAFRLLRDTFESTLVRQVKTRSPYWISENTDLIQQTILKMILKQVKHWGIEIVKCELMSPDLGATVSKALANVNAAKASWQEAKPKAEALAIATERAGTAEAFATAEKGKAAASNALAMLVAIADGIVKQAEAWKMTPVEVRGAEVAQVIAKESTILGAEGLAQAFGAVKIAATLIAKPKDGGTTG